MESEAGYLRENAFSLDEQPHEVPSPVGETTDPIAEEAFNELVRRNWETGPMIEFPEWDLRLRAGGRLIVDLFSPHPDAGIERAFGEQRSRFDYRTARLRLFGDWGEHLYFLAEYDFVGQGEYKNVFIGMRNLPIVGNLMVGHFKEPFGLEKLTDSRFIPFLEPGLPETFTPSKNPGVMVHGSFLDQRMTYAAGAFKQGGGKGFDLDDGDWITTARLTGLPWYEEEGRRLWHLGVAYRYEEPSDRPIRYSRNPESTFAPRLVDTGPIPARNTQQVGLETAFVYGPYTLQGEWITAFVSSLEGELSFESYYVLASVFLTGEHRPYNPDTGVFSRLEPSRSVWDSPGGFGAWEVALRYSGVDLNDRFIEGGRLNNVTVGVNWHLTPYHRMMFNYIHADLKRVGSEDIVQVRWQMDF